MSQPRTTTPRPISARFAVGAACACMIAAWLCAPAAAAAQLESRGRHDRYNVELEPHLVWQWTGDEASVDDGIGLGLRAAIPLLQDGPIPNINNNLALAFGIDWAHFSDNCLLANLNGRADCSEDDFWVPVTLQWNFFVTQMISLFPELGLGFRDAILDYDVCANGRCRRSDLEVHLVLWFGARFKVSERIALVVRLGTPSLLFGVSFFL